MLSLLSHALLVQYTSSPLNTHASSLQLLAVQVGFRTQHSSVSVWHSDEAHGDVFELRLHVSLQFNAAHVGLMTSSQQNDEFAAHGDARQ